MENKKLQSTEIIENESEMNTPAVDELEFIPAAAAEEVIENEKTPEPANIKENEIAAEEKEEEPSETVKTEEVEDAEEKTSTAYLIKLVAVLKTYCHIYYKFIPKIRTI